MQGEIKLRRKRRLKEGNPTCEGTLQQVFIFLRAGIPIIHPYTQKGGELNQREG
jgi:hypothetical protein